MDQPGRRAPRRMHHMVGSAAKRAVVTVLGAVVLLAGVVMILTPGPGLVAIAAGLAILGTEYDWAHRATVVVRRRSRDAMTRARARAGNRRRSR